VLLHAGGMEQILFFRRQKAVMSNELGHRSGAPKVSEGSLYCWINVS